MKRFIENTKKEWHRFKNDVPGKRFEGRYQRRHHGNQNPFSGTRLLSILAGVVITIVGLILMPVPGPGGTATTFIGLGLIGSEFRPVARFLDWLELHLRSWLEPLKAMWDKAPVPTKFLLGSAALVCMAGVSYGAYQLFR